MTRPFLALLLLALLVGAFLWVRAAAPASGLEPTRGPAAEPAPVAPSLEAVVPEPAARALEEQPQRMVIRTPAAPAPEAAVVRVHGRVLDASGGPVPGAEVQLRPARGVDAEVERPWRTRRNDYRRVRTDAHGAYSIDDAAPGLYDFCVGEGGIGGERTLHQVQIERDLEHDFHVVGFLELGGRVTRALRGAVTLSLVTGRHSSHGRLAYHSGEEQRLSLGEDGIFLFRGLEPGFHMLRASGPGHANQSFEFELVGSKTDARIELERGLTLGGVVERAYETAKPAVLVWIRRRGARDAMWGEVDWHDDGRFRYESLLPGSYEVEVQGIVTGKRDRRIRRDLVVQLDRDIEDFAYTLEDDVSAWLEVQLPAGSPLAYGELSATREGRTITTRVRVSAPGSGTVHEQWPRLRGMLEYWYEQPALELEVPPGAWDVRLELNGYEPWTRSLEIHEERFESVVLEPRSGRLLSLDYESDHVLVESRPAGTGAAWKLLLSRDARFLGSHSSPEGITQAWLETGRHDLRITSNDHAELLLTGVQIAPSSEPLVVDFEREAGRAIGGLLQSAAGIPLRTPLYLDRREPGRWIRQELKAQLHGGAFRFRGLTPGTYRATLDTAGRVVVATWELGDEDLVDQVIVASE